MKIGDRVKHADADELRFDGQPHIPAYRALRGVVLDVRDASARVWWTCDAKSSASWLPQAELAVVSEEEEKAK